MTPFQVKKLLDRRLALLCVAKNHALYERQHEEERIAAEREAGSIEMELDRAGVQEDMPLWGDKLPDNWMEIAEKFTAKQARQRAKQARQRAKQAHRT